MRDRLALLLFLFAMPAAGGLPVIEGIVLDEGQRPLRGIEVKLFRMRDPRAAVSTATTDANGRFQVVGLPHQASYRLTASYGGVYVLDVAPGEIHTIRVTILALGLCSRIAWEEMPSAARPKVWPPPHTNFQPIMCE